MMTEIKTTLSEIKTRFPQYDGRGYEIAGFVWFRVGTTCTAGFRVSTQKIWKTLSATSEKTLMSQTCRWLSASWGRTDSRRPRDNMAVVQKAQASMNDVPDFRGNVKAIPTDIYWDKRADEAFPNGGKIWRNGC